MTGVGFLYWAGFHQIASKPSSTECLPAHLKVRAGAADFGGRGRRWPRERWLRASSRSLGFTTCAAVRSLGSCGGRNRTGVIRLMRPVSYHWTTPQDAALPTIPSERRGQVKTERR